jgi:predicted kinase
MTELFAELVPAPSSAIDWQRITQAFDWFQRLEGCAQSPIYHAEGDVQIHTRMVCEALVTNPAWCALGATDRQSLFWAALLHDVAKPACTRIEDDGRITSYGHSRRGQVMARAILWRMGVPFAQRELICHLITHHQIPFYILERERPERLAHRISLQTRCDFAAILAEADARGRICVDQQRLLDNIELFRQLCRDENCISEPKTFPSAHSRFIYFRKEHWNAEVEAFDDTRVAVTMLSGPPAAGKNHWIAANVPASAVISLDALRAELSVAPNDPQGAVVAAAKAEARRLLAAGTPFIWNATNIAVATRAALIDLFAAYGANISIVYLEASEAEMTQRNSARRDPVPSAAIARMLDRWQPPDLTECHALAVELS